MKLLPCESVNVPPMDVNWQPPRMNPLELAAWPAVLESRGHDVRTPLPYSISSVPGVVAVPAVNVFGNAQLENVNGKMTPDASWPHFTVAVRLRTVFVAPKTLENVKFIV